MESLEDGFSAEWKLQLVPPPIQVAQPVKSKPIQRPAPVPTRILWLSCNPPSDDDSEALRVVMFNQLVRLDWRHIDSHWVELMEVISEIKEDEPDAFPDLHIYTSCQEKKFPRRVRKLVEPFCKDELRCNFLVKRKDWPIAVYSLEGKDFKFFLRWRDPQTQDPRKGRLYHGLQLDPVAPYHPDLDLSLAWDFSLAWDLA